ncbi:MAG: hypothetical protein AAF597_18160, partial [Bacteroidota bacterium]
LKSKLRTVLQAAADKATTKKKNIWSKDRTFTGVRTSGVSDITKKYLLQPHYFRKIIRFVHQSKSKKDKIDLSSLYDDTNPYIYLSNERDFVRTDEILIVSKSKIRLNTHPGNIVFLDFSAPSK